MVQNTIHILQSYIFTYTILHRSSDHCSEPDVGQAEEGEDQRAHEGVQDLEGGEEVGERDPREPDVGERRSSPMDMMDMKRL